MTSSKSFYITTPIYYVNDAPHIGHAYTTLACDVLARFKRLSGYQVKFLTGTDEHGQKVEKAAQKMGLDPQTFTDKVSRNFRDLAAFMNYSNDDFIRTTESRHQKSAQSLWKTLQENGAIYSGTYAGWYAVRDETFYGEAELTKGAKGELLAPTGARVEWVEEPSYFFRLSAWEDKLLQLYQDTPEFIRPVSRYNEVVSFVRQGLEDLSISRTSFQWGIKVPQDQGHVMYVWLDALANYLTAVSYPDMKSDIYKTYWPADIHVVGKDILRFHAVYWPAFLMAANLPLPRKVYAHGWWTNEGQKISKSLGNIINPFTLVETYGLDQVRYFLLREVPFGSDGDFSHKAIIGRINSELANDLGNLAQRVLSMVAKNCHGQIPPFTTFSKEDLTILDNTYVLLAEIEKIMEQQAFHQALEKIWTIVRAANGYIDSQAPWSLKKTDPQRMETVLYVLLEVIRGIALLLQPFIPDSASKILDQLSVEARNRTFSSWGKNHPLSPGVSLPAPQGVFPRFMETSEIQNA